MLLVLFTELHSVNQFYLTSFLVIGRLFITRQLRLEVLKVTDFLTLNTFVIATGSWTESLCHLHMHLMMMEES